MIRKTDIRMSKGIWVSQLANSRHPRKVLAISKMIEVTLPYFRKLLNLRPDLEFRIAPLKGRLHGRYNYDSKVIEINCRLTQPTALMTLAHELVHAEQYYQKRLQQKKRSGRWFYFWNGEITRKSYWNQPWEIEARQRQKELAMTVMEMINRDIA
jgi:hypothetical protein